MPGVLFAADGLWNGGAERQMTLLAESLPETWSPTVCSLTDGPYRHILEGLGIPVEVCPRHSRLDVTPAVSLWRVARSVQPAIVHSWGWMSTAAMLPFCKTRGIPLIDGTIRTGRPPRKRGIAGRIGILLADRVVANTLAGLRAFRVPEARGRVIYNGFDESRPAWRGASGSPEFEERTTVVMAARMFPEKDWETLLEAARTLSQGEPGGWRFICVGSGPDRQRLMDWARGLVSSGIVEFKDAGTEALPTIAAADVGVLLSNTNVAEEGCSNAIMEYMACGLPVVCTASGGNPELVSDGVNGRLIPAFDVDGLVASLRMLRSDQGAARRMGAEGRRRLLEEFSVERMVGEFVSCYEELGVRESHTRP